MKKTHLIIGILMLVILAGGVFFADNLFSGEGGFRRKLGEVTNEAIPLSGQVVTDQGKVIKVQIADTPETRQQGLSGFKKLEPDEGMLFVFDEPGIYPFWMKDMQFSIDILWLRKITEQEYRIVHIEQGVSPETFPQSFVSPDLADAVLEVPSGFTSVNNLDLRDVLWITLQEQ